MKLTNYQFDPAALAARAAEMAAPMGDGAIGYAAGVISRRLELQPLSYLAYGPYWWGVKQVLRSAGHSFGADDDEMVRAAYAGAAEPFAVLVAGEEFRGGCMASLMKGTREFTLGPPEDGRPEASYVLFDRDMEALAAGARPEAAGVLLPDEPLLDDVRVPFEEGGELWHAILPGRFGAVAGEMVGGLVASLAIGRAIDAARGLPAGRAMLDSASSPISVLADLASRTVRVAA